MEPKYRKPGGYPGVLAEGWKAEEIISDLTSAILDGDVAALRIANQPPYGYVFRVDDAELIGKVWKSKGRITPSGEIDFTKKPVTSLGQQQVKEYINMTQLKSFGFDEVGIEELLNLNIHTVLPVNDKMPNHLVTLSNYGPTISTIRFVEGDLMRGLVDNVSIRDVKAIVGGTSLNLDKETAIVDSKDLLERINNFPVVDYFVLSHSKQTDLSMGAFHSMIALKENRTIELKRQGIGMERINEIVRKNSYNFSRKD
jgi:hypothetical protein